QIAVRTENRPGWLVIGLKHTVSKSDSRLRVIVRGEKRRASDVTDRTYPKPCAQKSFACSAHRNCAGDRLHSERRIDRRLVRIRQRSAHLVQTEPRHQRRLVRGPVIDTNGELIRSGWSIQRQTGNLRTRQVLASAGLRTHLRDLCGGLEQHFSRRRDV